VATAPMPATSQRCGARRRPTANSGQAGTSERAHKIHEKMANTGEQRARVEREGEDAGGAERELDGPEMVARRGALD
jgi:hypothetical protein